MIICDFAKNMKKISADKHITQLRTGQFAKLYAWKICASLWFEMLTFELPWKKIKVWMRSSQVRKNKFVFYICMFLLSRFFRYIWYWINLQDLRFIFETNPQSLKQRKQFLSWGQQWITVSTSPINCLFESTTHVFPIFPW